MNRTPEAWLMEYRVVGGLWEHDGNSRRPHALLTSGWHSNGFFNSEKFLQDPCRLDLAAADLVEKLEIAGAMDVRVDRVVGPAMGAITLANDVARWVSSSYGVQCFRSYGEKSEDGFKFDRTDIDVGENLLPVEDVLTSGASVEKLCRAAEKKGGVVLPFVGLLVNRSGLSEVGGRRIVALIDHQLPEWTPEECPLCKEGSEALRPKGNWNKFIQAY